MKAMIVVVEGRQLSLDRRQWPRFGGRCFGRSWKYNFDSRLFPMAFYNYLLAIVSTMLLFCPRTKYYLSPRGSRNPPKSICHNQVRCQYVKCVVPRAGVPFLPFE